MKMSYPFTKGTIPTVAAGIIITVLAFSLFRSIFPATTALVKPGDPPALSVPRESSSHARSVRAVWDQVSLEPIASLLGDQKKHESGKPVTKRWGAVERAIGQERELDSLMRQQLLDALTNRFVARSAGVDDYIAFAERDAGARWITTNDTRPWTVLDFWWRYNMGKTVERDQPVERMKEGLSKLLIDQKMVLTSAASTNEGVRLFAMKVRQHQQIMLEVEDRLRKAPGGDEYRTWMNSDSASPLSFRVPPVSLEEYLEKEGQVTVVVALILVENAAGNRYLWAEILFWHRMEQRWFTESVNRKGWAGVAWW
jgi:hypothetical protein